MNHNHEFNSLLNEALAEYRDAEPLAGLEQRVLRRLEAQSGPTRNLWWRWSAALACVAALLLILWMGWRSRSHESAPPQPSTVQMRATPAPKSTAGSKGTMSARSARDSRRLPVPKLWHQVAALRKAVTAGQRPPLTSPVSEQFPTPVPLSQEERALITLARVQPDVLVNPPDADKELTIAPIEIKLLPEPNGDNAGEN